ncbi:hypothetical protein F441_08110 [Phytophthora nicotianae CJ01A1]|uniref:Uncharacterized protein n=4 Tax=Phytophthora nicotianae TaxID=4792 RepID=W2QBV2_PHYN3|nr:hypothetical protein PPTG_22825 [Phytophthora nicotianae INRA-310]ETL41051.1 hypothetical protein L916_07887 [Phytophthora nicotianae]ETP17494.1 hypothetical protein F441_08110 [Phytophthora nicotianae CJ01A1]ETP45527.1 hypothetical protein F442_08073 [Phytophthora nicotianae P10297]ETL94206.1 hypothetical protein L917_07781 [Phytophthora nicotianae]ETN09740.1 hypothetical protein PPTG_22825 [Phytophthora nicotianae INRA-310]
MVSRSNDSARCIHYGRTDDIFVVTLSHQAPVSSRSLYGENDRSGDIVEVRLQVVACSSQPWTSSPRQCGLLAGFTPAARRYVVVADRSRTMHRTVQPITSIHRIPPRIHWLKNN